MSPNITFRIIFCLECTFCHAKTFTKLNSPVLNLDYYFEKRYEKDYYYYYNYFIIIVIIIIIIITAIIIIINAIIITAM